MSLDSPPTPDSSCCDDRETFVIGDVHGCADELQDLLLRSEFDPTRHRGILAGDLYTRGPDAARVRQLAQEFQLEAIVGNHEERLKRRINRRRREERRAPRATDRVFDAMGSDLDAFEAELRSMPYSLASNHGDSKHPWRVIHAGIKPTHGFNPKDHKTLTNIRYWPPGSESRWHEFYEGEELLIFGHDAMGGLVERRDANGRPLAIGLDTACVYGGRLTGYFIERDAFVSVPARRAWWPITGID